MRVCVYCASSPKAPQAYRDAAFALGRDLAAAGFSIVFGGGGVGSMGSLADGAHDVGGRTIGVMPDFMREREWAHAAVTDWHWTADMAQRKARMLAESNALVALPGGCGTLEELLEALTLARLGLHGKPIVVVNQNGYFDPLREQLRLAVRECFMEARHLELIRFVPEVGDVLPAIRQALE